MYEYDGYVDYNEISVLLENRFHYFRSSQKNYNRNRDFIGN
jgi:hypothetical protein